MRDDNATSTPTGPPPPTGPEARQRRRSLLSLAAALLGIAFAAAACSSGPSGLGVAGAGTGTTPTTANSTANQGPPTLTPAQRAAAVAYSQCMRSHGVSNFPDPNSQGQLQIQGGPGSSLDPNSPAWQNAQKACQSKQPKPTPAQQAQAQQHLLQVSRCMRAHGIKDYPDPSFSGGKVSMEIQGGPGSDLNPANPLFQAAQKACDPNAPKLGPGDRTASPGGGGNGSFSTGGQFSGAGR